MSDPQAHPETVTLRLGDGFHSGWETLVEALKQARRATGCEMTFTSLIEQVEAQLPRSVPPEPMGLGAVVRAGDGWQYVRVTTARGRGDAWKLGHKRSVRQSYKDLGWPIEVLSEGVR